MHPHCSSTNKPASPRKTAVKRLLRLLAASDLELAEHSRRSALLAHDLATRMKLSTERLDIVHTAGHLHDVGKIFVPRDILDHPGPLTTDQWAELRHHPRTGYELVRDRVPEEIARIVLTHHERFDGTGYPNAIPGNSIPLEARILQVADAVDAITSVRPYQPAFPVQYAINEMVRCSGTQFDPSVVEAVVELAASPQWRATRFLDLKALDELAV